MVSSPSDLLLRLPPLALLLLACFLHGGLLHTETSYTWRLDVDMGKVMPASHFPQPPPPEKSRQPAAATASAAADSSSSDPQEAVLDILMSTVTNTDGTWKKTSRERACGVGCNRDNRPRNNRGVPIKEQVLSGLAQACA